MNYSKKKSIITRLSCAFMIVPVFCGTAAFAYDTTPDTLREKQLAFASQYDYHEGDFDKSFTEYPGIVYTSGIEYRQDKSKFECPAIYMDSYAMDFENFSIEQKNVTIKINGTTNPLYNKCVLFNDRLLVPADVFKDADCEVSFDENTYVTTISRNGVTLEILPNLIGMRKNRQTGFYVPLEVCARFIDDTMYIPVRAVANEFGFDVLWDSETRTVTLNS